MTCTDCPPLRHPPTVLRELLLTRTVAGMPLMKATSLPVLLTRTPQCHTAWKPGGCRCGGAGQRGRMVGNAGWQQQCRCTVTTDGQVAAAAAKGCITTAPLPVALLDWPRITTAAAVPVINPHLQGPAQELLAVGKPEHVVVVLWGSSSASSLSLPVVQQARSAGCAAAHTGAP